MSTSTHIKSRAFGIFVLLGLIALAVIIANLPFPAGYSGWGRAGVWFASAWVSAVLFTSANVVVKSVYKFMVEIAAVVVITVNATVVALLWAFSTPITAAIQAAAETSRLESVVTLILGGGLLLGIANLFALIVLHPLAQIAGTDIGLDD